MKLDCGDRNAVQCDGNIVFSDDEDLLLVWQVTKSLDTNRLWATVSSFDATRKDFETYKAIHMGTRQIPEGEDGSRPVVQRLDYETIWVPLHSDCGCSFNLVKRDLTKRSGGTDEADTLEWWRFRGSV